MALPIKEFLLNGAVDGAMAKARVLRDNVATAKARVDSGPAPADDVINLMRAIKVSRDLLAQYAAAPGLDAVAREQYNDPALNFSAELTAVVNACDTCLTWVADNFPKDASGWLLKDKIVNGALAPRVFTQAQLSTFSTTLGTLLAAFS
jgi:hypothetical protein